MKLNAASPMMIAGPTQSGKTQWVYKLLNNDMFKKPVSSILYCYGVHQPLYDEMQNTFKNKIEFNEGMPSEELIRSKNNGDFHIIVLDDLMERIVRDLSTQMLFTKFCHHYNFTTIFITQNIFEQGRCARTIALNTHILVLFANKRDESQIRLLAKQQAPMRNKSFLEAYEDATKLPYGYLVVDCAPSTPSTLKWRTNIFPDDEGPEICYIKKTFI